MLWDHAPVSSERAWPVVGHFESSAETPLLSRGGESRRGSGGWGGAGQTNYLLTTTTPSARAKVASQLFLCRAATPPRLRRGVYWRFHFPIGNRWSIATFNRATLTRGSPRKPRSAFSVYCAINCFTWSTDVFRAFAT